MMASNDEENGQTTATAMTTTTSSVGSPAPVIEVKNMLKMEEIETFEDETSIVDENDAEDSSYTAGKKEKNAAHMKTFCSGAVFRKQCVFLSILLGVVFIAAGVSLGVTISLRLRQQQSNAASDAQQQKQQQQLQQSFGNHGTFNFSFSPRPPRFPSPDAAEDLPSETEQWRRWIHSNLPSTIQTNLDDPTSPSFEALQWTLSESNIKAWGNEFTQSQVLQRFAIVSILLHVEHSDPASNIVHRKWMDPLVHECDWNIPGEFYEYTSFICSSQNGVIEQFISDGTQYPNTTFLPLELTLLTHLEKLRLISQPIAAAHPRKLVSDLGHLTKLTDLSITDYPIGGTLPKELGSLKLLERLAIRNCSIHGTVPTELGMLTELTTLHLDRNDLRGNIFTDKVIEFMVQLKDLHLEYNRFSGKLTQLPSFVYNFWASKLVYLDLGYNKFRGRIPTQIGRLTSLKLLALTGNFMIGRLPGELGELSNNLQSLYVAQNNFTGPLPTQLHKLTNLVHLHLYDNNLTNGIDGNGQPLDICGISTENPVIDCGEIVCSCCRGWKVKKC